MGREALDGPSLRRAGRMDPANLARRGDSRAAGDRATGENLNPSLPAYVPAGGGEIGALSVSPAGTR